ncbi:MAG: hypothetical protein V7733_22855, partial [Paraglaciecola polaris]|uniref:hypothetical protein n=1 Tax=Paraglaciecola polaris TaxID=222814 RepID=UPI00300378B9
MRTIGELAEYLGTLGSGEQDRYKAQIFSRYWDEYIAIDKAISQFSNTDFLHYHAFLSQTKSVKTVYSNLVAIRRLMGVAHDQGYECKVHPRYFDVPKKPSADHFNPLSDEQLEKLEDFLKRKITDIIEKEATFKTALQEGRPIEEIGAMFKKTRTIKPEVSFYKFQKPLNDCILLLYQERPKYPQNASLEQVSKGGYYSVIHNIDYDLMDTPFRLVFKRMGIQRLKATIPFLVDAPDLNFVDVIGFIYPRIFEVYVMTWAICLETGWSQDMVGRIDFNDYIFSPIPIESDFVFIKTTKQKGLNDDDDINKAKQFIHPSSKSNPMSAYNLIRLFATRSGRLRHGRLYENQVAAIGSEPFFVYYNESSGLPILTYHPDRPQ